MCKTIIIIASCLSCPVFSKRPLLLVEMSVWLATSLGKKKKGISVVSIRKILKKKGLHWPLGQIPTNLGPEFCKPQAASASLRCLLSPLCDLTFSFPISLCMW